MRILVADDDRATRFVLGAVLMRQLECDVVEAADGREALEHLSNETYDLIVLDVHMPVLSGMELLRVIRKSPAHAAVPVAMLTSDRNEDVVLEAAQLGIAAYLAKPLDLERAAGRLAHLLQSATRQ